MVIKFKTSGPFFGYKFPISGPLLDYHLQAFGDFSYYKIGDRGNRSFQDLKELFAGNGMVGFLGKERVDGILVLREAVKLLKIGATA